jgi:hypothetical protein
LFRFSYKNHEKPVLTIKEAMKYPERTVIHIPFGPPNVFNAGEVEGKM